MEERYFSLFFATGSPVFYLLYRLAASDEEEAKTAWHASRAQLL